MCHFVPCANRFHCYNGEGAIDAVQDVLCMPAQWLLSIQAIIAFNRQRCGESHCRRIPCLSFCWFHFSEFNTPCKTTRAVSSSRKPHLFSPSVVRNQLLCFTPASIKQVGSLPTQRFVRGVCVCLFYMNSLVTCLTTNHAGVEVREWNKPPSRQWKVPFKIRQRPG